MRIIELYRRNRSIFRPFKSLTLLLPELLYLRLVFFLKHGYRLNLKNPKTYNEKLQWLKINERSDLHTICADKFLVREYVKKQIGEEYLIPLVYQTKNTDEISVENMPKYPVIIKPNHCSGIYFIVRDTNALDWKFIRETLKDSLKKNYYKESKEWQYKNIEPRIIIEKLLTDNEGDIPDDIKIHCFNGKPKLVLLCKNRETNLTFHYFDVDKNRIDLSCDGKTDDIECKLPDNFDTILKLSEKLSSEFTYARIDFMVSNEKIYFGEITFHPGSGFEKLEPAAWDYKLGDMIKIDL